MVDIKEKNIRHCITSNSPNAYGAPIKVKQVIDECHKSVIKQGLLSSKYFHSSRRKSTYLLCPVFCFCEENKHYFKKAH